MNGNGDVGAITGRLVGQIHGSRVENTTMTLYQVDENRSIGGVSGTQRGTSSIANTSINGVTLRFIGYDKISEREVQPNMGLFVGHSESTSTRTGLSRSGTNRVDIGDLKTVTWNTGMWPFQTSHSHNQAQFAGGDVGRIA